MTALSVTVKTGKIATQLTGAPMKGATIYNQDFNNGIWIGSDSTVAPQRGQFIGPLGRGTWTSDTANAYACVDTGVSSDVLVTISDDLGDIDNPLLLAEAIVGSGLAAAIGVQVATELLTTGVPGLFNNPLLAQYSPLVAGTAVSLNDIEGYASLAIEVNGGGNPGIIKWFMHQETPWTPFGSPGGSNGFVDYLSNIDGNLVPVWVIPVVGASVRFSNIGAFDQYINVYGSNRQIISPYLLGNDYLPRKLFFGPAATSAGVAVPLVSNDSNTLSSTSYNGMCYARCSTGPIQSSIGYQYLDSGNVIRTSFIALNIPANTSQMVSFPHPPCVIKWIAQSATTGTNQFGLDIIPMSH